MIDRDSTPHMLRWARTLSCDVFKATSSSLHRFVVTGSLTVAIDALAYFLLLKLFVPTNVAKGLSLIAATLFAYFVNKLWAFSDSAQPTGRLIPFLCLYASAILLNIAVNGLGIAVFGQTRLAFTASWFLATASSSTWNYLGLRYIVFPNHANQA